MAVDLTTMKFIQLRRFFGIHGYPAVLLSDNGSQMVGAAQELWKMVQGLDSDQRLSTFFLPITRSTKSAVRKTDIFFIWLHYGGFGEIFIVFWTRKAKSLNFIHLFSMFRE